MKTSEIESYLNKLSLPMPSKPTLLEIAKILGGKFSEKLTAAAGGDSAAAQYVTSVIKATSPFCRQTLGSHGFENGLERLVQVAVNEGPTLFRALNALHKGGDMGSIASTYLECHFPFASNGQGKASDSVTKVSTTNASIDNSSQEAKADSSTTVAGEEKKQINTFHVYAGKAALCFGEDQSVDGRVQTLRIEVAPANPGKPQNAKDRYLWGKRIGVQLTQEEMYWVLCVFLNMLESVEFSGHGAEHDKTLSIEVQPANYFVKIGRANVATFAVPVRATAAPPIVAMIRKQIKKNDPSLDDETLKLMLQNCVSMINAASENNAKRRQAA